MLRRPFEQLTLSRYENNGYSHSAQAYQRPEAIEFPFKGLPLPLKIMDDSFRAPGTGKDGKGGHTDRRIPILPFSLTEKALLFNVYIETKPGFRGAFNHWTGNSIRQPTTSFIVFTPVTAAIWKVPIFARWGGQAHMLEKQVTLKPRPYDSKVARSKTSG